ncbi:MAG: hypothetical protein M0R46_09905 [Candidatus Muirbacterium halophilum]|nr:hypothetical protein [Candidatus Muirbacterium halophilum]
MKKYLIVSLASLMFVGCGTTQINPEPTSSNMKFKNEMDYQKGYNDAIKAEREKWFNQGYERALNIVKKYSSEILAYEAGKYALKNKFVTYPKLVANMDGGAMSIKSLGCDIRKSMNIDDIFHFYGANINLLPTQDDVSNLSYSSNDNAPTLQNIYTNAYTAPQNSPISVIEATSNTSNRPIATQVLANNQSSSILSLSKNQQTKDNIDKFGLNCTENSNGYNCSFNNEQEKSWFCKETGICK